MDILNWIAFIGGILGLVMASVCVAVLTVCWWRIAKFNDEQED